MSRSELLLTLVLVGAAMPALAIDDYGLGRKATSAEVAEWNIDVRPDGQGLPKGHGSVSDGEMLYEEKCASCHGSFGESNAYMALTGGIGSLTSSTPTRSVGSKLNDVTTLWDYIYRAMPFTAPKTLTVDETYSLVAYVLNLNDILPADAELDQDSLLKVKMPNRDGFTRDHGMGSVDGKPDTHNTRCMKKCETEVKITSSLPDGFTKNLYGDISNNFRHYGDGKSAVAPAAGAKPEAPSGLALAKQHACTACHGVDHKIVGPAFRDVAKHYQGQDGAFDQLMKKIAAGGAGNWGAVPMPAQGSVSEDDRKAILKWILSGAPE